MSSKIHFLTLGTSEATALWKKFQELISVKSFEDKCTFLPLFHFLSDYFDTDSSEFDFDI